MGNLWSQFGNNFSIEMPGVALSMISDLLASLSRLFSLSHVRMSDVEKWEQKGDMKERQ